MIFKPNLEAPRIVASATILIKLLLDHKKPEVAPEHYKELLKILLGKITEAHSKDKTLYRSQNAINDTSKLRHEHVYQRRKMIEALWKAESEEEIDRILGTAIACAVTHDEHKSLNKFDHLYGWERYEKAGIVVMDTSTWPPKPVDLKLLIGSSLNSFA